MVPLLLSVLGVMTVMVALIKGAVYLFTKESGIWTQTLKISDNGGGDGELDVDLINGDNFGSSVALAGTILAVGAYFDNDGGAGSHRGAVYLFTNDGTTWTQTLKISENGGGDGKLHITLALYDHNFGRSVALEGTILAVGGPGYSSPPREFLGDVHLFDASAMRYVAQSGNSCSAAPPQKSLPYVDPAATFTSTDNTKHVCFWAADQAGNIGKGVTSSSLTGIPASLTATFRTWTPAIPAKSKTLAVLSVTAGAVAKYKILGPTVPCTATAYSAASAVVEKTLSLTSGSGSIVLSSEADNNKYACVKLSKANRTNRYFRSPTVGGIDKTGPTVTDTNYYTDANLQIAHSTASPITGAAIYTNIIFSENLKNVVATGTIARPEISYTANSTKTQYNIVAHTATLSSGQCKAKSASDTSEYTCLYTVTGSDSGIFKTTVGVKTEDIAGNVFSLAPANSAPFKINTIPSPPSKLTILGQTRISKRHNPYLSDSSYRNWRNGSVVFRFRMY